MARKKKNPITDKGLLWAAIIGAGVAGLWYTIYWTAALNKVVRMLEAKGYRIPKT